MGSSCMALMAVALALLAGGCAARPDPRVAERRRLRRELDELDRLIHEDPQPLYEDYPAECPVHHVALLDDVVPILRGLPAEVVYPQLRPPDSQFPYASSRAFGGCSIRADLPKNQRVKYCPDCRALEAEWMRDVYEPRLKALRSEAGVGAQF